jgi:hypothetical protein
MRIKGKGLQCRLPGCHFSLEPVLVHVMDRASALLTQIQDTTGMRESHKIPSTVRYNDRLDS